MVGVPNRRRKRKYWENPLSPTGSSRPTLKETLGIIGGPKSSSGGRPEQEKVSIKSGTRRPLASRHYQGREDTGSTPFFPVTSDLSTRRRGSRSINKGRHRRFFTTPNNMIKIVCFVALLVGVLAQRGAVVDEAPKPFQFDYAAKIGGDGEVAGDISHTANGDANGRVEGSYSLTIEDGRKRVVDYVADKDGFRANVRSNEPGFKDESPNDAVFGFL